jgi:phage terminase large subunit-like protein
MATVLENPWIPHDPEPRQVEFLLDFRREVLYGGAAGGGKSDALLMGAAQFVETPGYGAILFRKTYTDLALEDALMDRAHDWFGPVGAHWSEKDKRWTFPSGATITFGYLDGPRDHQRYQSAAFQYVGFDEATQIREKHYKYMFSRLRRLAGVEVPLRVRAASNPGGESHTFFHERFVEPRTPEPSRIFIPATLEDNPHLDASEYEQALQNLDDIEYRQLRYGEWVEDVGESVFNREWFKDNRYDPKDPRLPRLALARFAAFDTANKDDVDNAYTVGVIADLMPDYTLLIRDVRRGKPIFPDLPEWTTDVLRRHIQDLKLKGVWIEEAASGLQLLQVFGRTAPAWLRNILWASRPVKSKEDRWKAAALWCKRGCVKLPHPDAGVSWLYDFEQEIFKVPNSQFLDQADAFSMLINELEASQGVLSEGWAAHNRVGAA